MSVMEAPAKPIFGPITVDDFRKNELLVKTVLPLVRDACKLSKGRFNENEVFDGIIAGTFKLWGVLRPPVLESILVTTVHGDVFSVLLLGPNAQKALAFVEAVELHAKRAGCSRMQIVGPRIWRHRPTKADHPVWAQLSEDWQEVACVFERNLNVA